MSFGMAGGARPPVMVGLRIAIAGTLQQVPGYEATSIIQSFGGEFAGLDYASIIVAGADEAALGFPRCMLAIQRGVPVVKEQWLLDCHRQNVLVSTAYYLWLQPGARMPAAVSSPYGYPGSAWGVRASRL